MRHYVGFWRIGSHIRWWPADCFDKTFDYSIRVYGCKDLLLKIGTHTENWLILCPTNTFLGSTIEYLHTS